MYADNFTRAVTRMRSLFLIYFIAFGAVICKAQQNMPTDTVDYVSDDCRIVQTKQKLDKQFFAYTPPMHLRANNSEFVYATMQLGKRKKKLFLYIQVLDKNICIKKDKVLDIYFKSGEVATFKNDFKLNCDGFFARQLKKDEVERLKVNDIILIRLYTYQKNLELYVSNVQNEMLHRQLDCLAAYEVKKTEEVKLKKRRSRKENAPEPIPTSQP